MDECEVGGHDNNEIKNVPNVPEVAFLAVKNKTEAQYFDCHFDCVKGLKYVVQQVLGGCLRDSRWVFHRERKGVGENDQDAAGFEDSVGHDNTSDLLDMQHEPVDGFPECEQGPAVIVVH